MKTGMIGFEPTSINFAECSRARFCRISRRGGNSRLRAEIPRALAAGPAPETRIQFRNSNGIQPAAAN